MRRLQRMLKSKKPKVASLALARTVRLRMAKRKMRSGKWQS